MKMMIMVMVVVVLVVEMTVVMVTVVISVMIFNLSSYFLLTVEITDEIRVTCGPEHL